MDGLEKNNDGYKYVLSLIDCFTKFAWVFPMKKITCQGVIEHLRTLFSMAENIPEKIQSDRGAGNFLIILKETVSQCPPGSGVTKNGILFYRH